MNVVVIVCESRSREGCSSRIVQSSGILGINNGLLAHGFEQSDHQSGSGLESDSDFLEGIRERF